METKVEVGEGGVVGLYKRAAVLSQAGGEEGVVCWLGGWL